MDLWKVTDMYGCAFYYESEKLAVKRYKHYHGQEVIARQEWIANPYYPGQPIPIHWREVKFWQVVGDTWTPLQLDKEELEKYTAKRIMNWEKKQFRAMRR